MNTSKHSSPLIGCLVVFGCVFVGIIFFTSYDTITASQDPIYAGGSSSPYPPPGTQVPIPTSTAVNPGPTPTQIVQIPVDTSFDQAAITYIAQNMEIDPGSLSLVESSTIVIPITQKRLWDGVIVDPNGEGKIEETKENLSNDTHAGYVTGVIVGDDDNRPYKGVAYDNSWIYSTNIDTLVEDLAWLADRTHLVNGSISFDATRNMLTSDRVFDYFSRSRNILFVIAAGNDDGVGFNVRSPAKAYNPIAVGAFDSHDDTSWNDTMADFSC